MCGSNRESWTEGEKCARACLAKVYKTECVLLGLVLLLFCYVVGWLSATKREHDRCLPAHVRARESKLYKTVCGVGVVVVVVVVLSCGWLSATKREHDRCLPAHTHTC